MRQSMRGRTPIGPVREPPWWKEMLGVRPKWEWALAAVGLLFFLGYAYEEDAPWKAGGLAVTAVVATLVDTWLKWRRETAGQRESMLGLRDSEGNG